MRYPEPVELLRALVRAPSPSGQEEPALDVLQSALEDAGHLPRRLGRNLWCEIGEGSPTLWLNSHLDTVRPAADYSFPPWCGEVDAAGRILGLGANDAKGSVAALTCAFCAMAGQPFRGKLVLVATCDEETGGAGLEWVRQEMPKPDAVLVGEPNEMTVANCCKGLVRAIVEVEGRSSHAARPWQGVNAIRQALPALEALCRDFGHAQDPVLGRASHEPTTIEGGHQPNALPDRVRIVVDCRTTPAFDNQAMVRFLRQELDGLPGTTLTIKSDRLDATRTSPQGRLVLAALAERDQRIPRPFEGVCDFVHVGDCDSIVMGPGVSERSHRADEYLEVDELLDAVEVYTRVVRRYFA